MNDGGNDECKDSKTDDVEAREGVGEGKKVMLHIL